MNSNTYSEVETQKQEDEIREEEILVKYEYYCNGISKNKNIKKMLHSSWGIPPPWYRKLRNEVENEYYYLCDKEKLAILLAKAFIVVYKRRTYLEGRIYYDNFIKNAKKHLYKMDKNIIPVVPI